VRPRRFAEAVLVGNEGRCPVRVRKVTRSAFGQSLRRSSRCSPAKSSSDPFDGRPVLRPSGTRHEVVRS
jgi:hypothetical protein